MLPDQSPSESPSSSSSLASLYYAAGENDMGQLGIGKGSFAFNLTAVPLPPWQGNSVTGVAAGGFHTLLTVRTSLYAVGSNSFGQLGSDAVGSTAYTFQLVPGPWDSASFDISLVSAGWAHSLVIVDGSVYTFGWNGNGQLGADVNFTFIVSPVNVSGSLAPWGSGQPTLAACGGMHTLVAVGTNVYACGANAFGQLGLNNDVIDVYLFQTLISDYWGAVNVVGVAAGYQHSAILTGTAVYTFGDDSDGKLCLGVDRTQSNPIPTQVPLHLTEVTEVSAGYSHTLISGVFTGGSGSQATPSQPAGLYACGDNTFGQLGIGGATSASVPTSVQPTYQSASAPSIVAGQFHSVLVTTAGDVYTFGRNDFGQLGIGTTVPQNVPTKANLPWDTSTYSPRMLAASNGTLILVFPVPTVAGTPPS